MGRVSDSRVQNYLVLGLMGVGDLVAGIVLSAIGLTKDNQVLSIVGTVLLISGAGMLAFLVWSRNKPETL
jgi:branched-subunit amino acid transport protein AzlD